MEAIVCHEPLTQMVPVCLVQGHAQAASCRELMSAVVQTSLRVLPDPQLLGSPFLPDSWQDWVVVQVFCLAACANLITAHTGFSGWLRSALVLGI